MNDLVKGLMDDIQKSSEAGEAASLQGASAAAFVQPDVGVSKIQGVRARKSCDFLARPQTLQDICVALLVTQPLERYMHWLFKVQTEKAWLASDPTCRPVVNLVTLQFSPAVAAVNTLAKSLQQPLAESLSLFDGNLTAIWPQFAIPKPRCGEQAVAVAYSSVSCKL